MSSSAPPPRRPRRGAVPFAPFAFGATIALVGAGLALPPKSPSHPAEPTFAKDVAPVVFRNCTTCHRPGGLGPFTLLDADTAAAYAAEIKDAVKTGFMPPWHADGPKGVFRNDRRLSDAERQVIIDWASTGAKKGNKKEMPPAPDYPTGWTIVPDAIVSMTEDFTIPASGTVEYMYFEAPTGFTEDKWVQAIEFMPGAREGVHHILVYARVPTPPGAAAPAPAPRPAGAPAPRPLFLRNPAYNGTAGPRRVDTRNAPPRQLGNLIGGTAPGTNVMDFPKGTAMKIPAGTVLTFQMHYTAKGHEMHDRSKVGFKFATEAPSVQIFTSAFTNQSFTLPAGAKDVAVPSELAPTELVKIWGLLPHTHLRGVRWKYTLENPDGTSQVVLDVPRYDFNWQTYYLFATPLEIPAGAKLMAMAWYDNSTSHKGNPDPTQDVHWGDQTWEEMQYTGILYSVPSRDPKKPGAPN